MYKIYVITLGCPKNQVDSEIMLGAIQTSPDFMIIDSAKKADIIIINTCGFIKDAKEESIETILQVAYNREALGLKALVVTGCLTQRYRDQILSEIPEIDAIMGTGNQAEIIPVLREVVAGKKINKVGKPEFNYNYSMPRQLQTSHYAYVKIADGCNNNCTYCSIPQIKGPVVSRPISDIYREVKQLARTGIKEIIIIAQDITRYGIDIYEKPSLVTLLRKLVKIQGIKWIRLLYAYPEHITEELIELIATEDNICNYLDIPIQHSSERIRGLMKREGSRKELEHILTYIKKSIPDIVLRTTLIVGFPGETGRDFKNLYEFVREQRFARLGVFKYSREEGTAAAEFSDQIPEEEKEKRYHDIMQLQRSNSRTHNQKLVGQTMKIIVDEMEEGEVIGRTCYDAPEIDNQIIVPGAEVSIGDMPYCRITAAYEYELIGEIVDESTQ